MNQEQNNLNPNNFNTQGNNGIPNNQPLNNQSFNQGMGVNQQPINPQPQPTPSSQQPINQMNMQQPIPQPMNTFESGNASNQSFNSKPTKKINLGLIIDYHITNWYINENHYVEKCLLYNLTLNSIQHPT